MKGVLKEAVCLFLIVILVMVSVSSCIQIDDMLAVPTAPSPAPTTYEEFLWSLPPELLSNVWEGLAEQISDLQDRQQLVSEIQQERRR